MGCPTRSNNRSMVPTNHPIAEYDTDFFSNSAHQMMSDAMPTQVDNNTYTMSSKELLIKYLHNYLFRPPKRTLIKAIINNQFATYPDLNTNAVHRYLPDALQATDKGHIKRQR